MPAIEVIVGMSGAEELQQMQALDGEWQASQGRQG